MPDERRAQGLEVGDLLKGLAAGLVGGLVASWTMNRFQAMLSKQIHGIEKGHGAQSIQQGAPEESWQQELEVEDGEKWDEDATERVAASIAEGIFDRQLNRREKEEAGTAVHYAFGITSGAFYGVAAELAPPVTIGAGLPFGVVFWLLADEIVTPALGLKKKPTDYPPSIHAYSLASHLVYALTAETVRRTLRNAI